MKRFTKDDISFHSSGSHYVPAVNVKIYMGRRDFPFSQVQKDHDAPGLTQEWIDAHLTEREQSAWWDDACSQGWDQLQEDTNAEGIFGRDVAVFSEGRMSGWAVVYRGKDDRRPLFTKCDVETWDAVAVARWGKFARFARQTADDVPYQYLSMICLNVYEPWLEDQTKNEPARAIVRAARQSVESDAAPDDLAARGALTVLTHAEQHLTRN